MGALTVMLYVMVLRYAMIGGSPIRKWTELQGEKMSQLLDSLSPATAPHKAYVMFRYADPLTEETLLRMKNDGVSRAVAFSQYAQYSCTTTGSSLNHLWRELHRLQLSQAFTWSLIDRWPTHPLFIKAVVERIKEGLARFPTEDLSKAIIVFSAHSLPMRVVNRGDPYPAEVAATVSHVMAALSPSLPYLLAWQSQVGFLPWLGPKTVDVIKGLGAQGHKHLLVVPIAFTSDHVETLFELDIEYGHVAKEAGITHYLRAPSLNGSEHIFKAQATIVAEHLASHSNCTSQYPLTCAMCVNPLCRSLVKPAYGPYKKLRDQVNPHGPLSKHIVNEHSTSISYNR